MPLQTFDEIERDRIAMGLPVARLCAEAGVTATTYWRLQRGRCHANALTLARLGRALRRLKRAEPAVSADRLVTAFRGYLFACARHEGVNPADVLLGFDVRDNRPGDPRWLTLARVRQAAVYLTITELDVPGAELARALGVSKQAISKTLRSVEDRRDDPAFDRLIDTVARLITGKAAA